MALDIFISYAHEDEQYRNDLIAHLANLRNQGIIQNWYDGDIVPGTEWEAQILTHLATAQIILLLVSSDFMNSDFCDSVELKQAIARHNADQARVIPIILRPTDWEGASFAKLLALPTYAKPISKWEDRDEAFTDVIRGIRRAIDDLNRSSSPNPR